MDYDNQSFYWVNIDEIKTILEQYFKELNSYSELDFQNKQSNINENINICFMQSTLEVLLIYVNLEQVYNQYQRENEMKRI